ncbi:hypothetical protein PMAYCL1PPCAC_20602, partial [Pristionchus mayeri]
NESFMRFAFGNFLSGGAAGATVHCIVHPLENAFARPAVIDSAVQRKPRVRGDREGLVGRLLKTMKLKGISRGLFAYLPGTVVHRGVYFGFY